MKRPTLDLRPPRRPPRPEPVEESNTTASLPDLLGEWLVHSGVITPDQLREALMLARRHEWRIGDALVVLRFASRKDVETEAARFARHHRRCEPGRPGLERRARWMEREAEIRRITRAAADGNRPG